MSEATKTCNLFQSEIETLIEHHAKNISEDISGRLDSINYLNKRLKAFSEPAADVKSEPAADVKSEPAADVKSEPATAAGWASN